MRQTYFTKNIIRYFQHIRHKAMVTAMPLRHERETPSGPIKLNVGKIRVLVDVNIIVI